MRQIPHDQIANRLKIRPQLKIRSLRLHDDNSASDTGARIRKSGSLENRIGGKLNFNP